MELRGKRVLITGASRGIGEGLAHRFASEGALVALVARSAEAIEKLAAGLGGTAHPADLADTAQVATLVHRVEDEAGPVDVLVNNAGVGLGATFLDTTLEDWDWIIELCEEIAVPARASCSGVSGGCKCDALDFAFLDGGVFSRGGDYFIGIHGAWVYGFRSLRFLCYERA